DLFHQFPIRAAPLRERGHVLERLQVALQVWPPPVMNPADTIVGNLQLSRLVDAPQELEGAGLGGLCALEQGEWIADVRRSELKQIGNNPVDPRGLRKRTGLEEQPRRLLILAGQTEYSKARAVELADQFLTPP